ncbi:nucleotidyl transferase AbiEii/AbiGii toxin family protein [Endozoicomonas atrinae]|uniref:nucleotidyl transferase AbiEii/AbiGii toxin family protein n=1 Tax=Endozoicomonas atrinae TaxID=1333660 RepID=UPI003AFF884E
MDRSGYFYKQVQLLLQVLPFISKHSCFALKGGTAINLFVRNLPRLSVDIDLVYLPLKERNEALSDIRQALGEVSADLQTTLQGIDVIEAYKDKEDALRLIVQRSGVQIKVELSPVLRGTVFEPEVLSVSEAVEEEFGYAEMLVVRRADLYAGKICAALDRQHPRDLYDVKWLLENEGLTDDLRKALLIYIISHNRPISELLNPVFKDIDAVYKSEFADMTEVPVSLEELQSVRQQLVEQIHIGLTSEEKQFLLSFKRGEPDWPLLGIDGAETLPAVKWKQHNLSRMPKNKLQRAYEKLAEVLGVDE